MFIQKSLLITLSLFMGIIGFGQSIDTDQSLAIFEISNMKINTVEGTLKGMNGNITFDADNLELCSFDVCMDATTINTSNSKRDEHLQQVEYFHTQNYGDICFESYEIRNAEQGGFAVIGTLSMRGVTKDVMIPFSFDGNTFNGSLSLSRYDYNIGSDVGKFMIGEQVDISIICQVSKP